VRMIRSSIAGRLVAAFFVVSLAWAVLCFVSFRFLTDTKSTYSELLNVQTEGLSKAKEMQYHVEVQSNALVAYMNTVRSGSLGDIQSGKRLSDSNAAVEKLVSEAEKLLKTQEDADSLARIAEWNRQFKAKSEETVNAIETNLNKASVMMKMDIEPLANRMIAETNRIVQHSQQLKTEREASIDKRVSRTIVGIGIASLALFAAAIAASYVYARRMAKPLAKMAEQTAQIASGNLQVERTRHVSADEIGRLSGHFLEMSDSLRDLIERIAGTADEIGQAAGSLRVYSTETKLASGQIASAMEQVQEAVELQTRHVDETERSARGMAEGVGDIARNAREAADQAEAMMRQADRGAEEMAATVEQMSAIAESIGQLRDAVIRSGSKSERIGEIVGVISSVAKQTQILALNASIEASRAGAGGQGFAVIAEEVRKLSSQTAESAADIGRFVDEIAGETRLSFDAAEQSRMEADRGMTSVRQARATFETFRSSFETLAAGIREIDAAAERIDRMTEEVRHTMASVLDAARSTTGKAEEVSASTEEQFAAMEEMASSAEALGRLADRLQEATSRFKL